MILESGKALLRKIHGLTSGKGTARMKARFSSKERFMSPCRNGQSRFVVPGLSLVAVWFLFAASAWADEPPCAVVREVAGEWSETGVSLLVTVEAATSCASFNFVLPSGEGETRWVLDFHNRGTAGENARSLSLPPLSPGKHVLFLARSYPIRCESRPLEMAERQIPALPLPPTHCEARWDLADAGSYRYRISESMKEDLVKTEQSKETAVRTISEIYRAVATPDGKNLAEQGWTEGNGGLRFHYETLRDYETRLLTEDELFSEYFQDAVCPALDWFHERIGIGTKDFKPVNAWIWYTSCMRWHDGITGYDCKSIDRYNAEQSYRNSYAATHKKGLPDVFETGYPRHRTFGNEQFHAAFDTFLRLVQKAETPPKRAGSPVLETCLGAQISPVKTNAKGKKDLKELEAFRKRLTPSDIATYRVTVFPKIYE